MYIHFHSADLNSGSASSYPAFFFGYQNMLIFSATVSAIGREPVIYDGNEFQFLDLSPGKSNSSPYYYKEFNYHVYFLARDSLHGRELYHYDGEQAMMVADINPWSGDGTPRRDFRISYEAVIYL